MRETEKSSTRAIVTAARPDDVGLISVGCRSKPEQEAANSPSIVLLAVVDGADGASLARDSYQERPEGKSGGKGGE